MWVSDWVVNMLFPLMRDGLGIAATFFIFSFFCVVSFVYAKRYLFETKGKSLEEIEELLSVDKNKALLSLDKTVTLLSVDKNK